MNSSARIPMPEKTVDNRKKHRYNVLAENNASVAQSVVHLTRNEKVACSSQVTSSNKKNHPLGWFFCSAKK